MSYQVELLFPGDPRDGLKVITEYEPFLLPILERPQVGSIASLVGWPTVKSLAFFATGRTTEDGFEVWAPAP